MKLMMKIVLLGLLIFYTSGCGLINKPQNQQSSQVPQTPQDQAESSSDPGAQASQGPTQTTSPACQWIGVDQDVVSPNEIKVDGKADGHFHLTVPFNQSVALKSIMIRYSEFGKSFKWSWVYNQNLPIQGYVMGVLDESGKAVLPQGDNGYRVDGSADFELYLSELENENGRDTFKFADNQTIDLEINYVTEKNQERQFRNTVKIEKGGTNGADQTGGSVI